MHTRAHIHTYARAHLITYTRTYTHKYTHSLTHAHTHVYTHAKTSFHSQHHHPNVHSSKARLPAQHSALRSTPRLECCQLRLPARAVSAAQFAICTFSSACQLLCVLAALCEGCWPLCERCRQPCVSAGSPLGLLPEAPCPACLTLPAACAASPTCLSPHPPLVLYTSGQPLPRPLLPGMMAAAAAAAAQAAV